jgi:hypothetical protein
MQTTNTLISLNQICLQTTESRKDTQVSSNESQDEGSQKRDFLIYEYDHSPTDNLQYRYQRFLFNVHCNFERYLGRHTNIQEITVPVIYLPVLYTMQYCSNCQYEFSSIYIEDIRYCLHCQIREPQPDTCKYVQTPYVYGYCFWKMACAYFVRLCRDNHILFYCTGCSNFHDEHHVLYISYKPQAHSSDCWE